MDTENIRPRPGPVGWGGGRPEWAELKRLWLAAGEDGVLSSFALKLGHNAAHHVNPHLRDDRLQQMKGKHQDPPSSWGELAEPD